MPFPIAHPKVIRTARQILGLNPVFLDTETTGTNPSDVIIEIGIVDLNGDVLFESLVNPGFHIPAESSAVNQIFDEDVASAPRWETVWPEVSKVLTGQVVGMYNAEFDLRLLRQSNSTARLPWSVNTNRTFCVMNLYAAFYGEWNPRHNGFRFHKLEQAGKMSGIPLPNSHHAIDDARLTAALFRYIADFPINLS